MAIFQKSVLNKFIKSQDSSKIDIAYRKFSEIFLQAERQAEIRSMKEEEYQDGFLDDLFVNVLGYVKRPNTGYNLVREKKNEADSKKADGAILKNDLPLAVIELKGTDTTDLDKVTEQGFGYKNNHKECVYVVTSNFEKLRFFIHNAVEFIEFNLFTLSKEDFIILWLCLHSDNLLDNIPAKIKSESVVREEDITKNLYKDYSSFKQELWQNIVALNPNGDHLMFYKKTQKLIDRFLFIFFAEDAGLLPPNSISRMVDRWKMLKDEDAYKPLYDIFKQYFGYINTGRPGKTPQDEIFAYNGGLMLEDDVLESISIDDDILLKHVSKLTSYDFSSEVDVNILGHIFENSLNDIEAVTAELEGQEIDKSKTKRKKDGVFYTPKYITKYIVENTVGKLCQEKKIELNIIDEEYAKGRTHHKKENLKKLDKNLQDYRNWLLQITICDPACGSGAFLNQALEFLMEEHQYIDELESKLLGSGFKFPGVENHILENNIFGVDINEESVEIAKLSLWLRTAQRGRKLTSLNNNIKCGNSLIDDPEVAGDKAFNWKSEFVSVFENGGFDVVIGNPPYVQINENQNYYATNYFTSKSGDLYALFYERGIEILKTEGAFSFITPSLFIKGIRYESLRVFLLENTKIIEIDDKGDGVFEQVQMPTAIFVAIKEKIKNQDWSVFLSGDAITSKMESNCKRISTICDIRRGLEIGKDKVFDFNPDLIKIITGEDVERFAIKNYQSIDHYTYNEFKKDEKYFINKRIVIRETGNRITALIVDEIVQQNRSLYSLLRKDDSIDYEYLLSIINSKLMQFYYKSKFAANTDVFPKIRISQVKDLPIKISNSINQKIFVEKVISFMDQKIEFEKITINLQSLLKSKYNIIISKKLSNWCDLIPNQFLQELKKLKITITLKEESDWLNYFIEQQVLALNLKCSIERIDKEIDSLVYNLYELTDEEIQIVENS